MKIIIFDKSTKKGEFTNYGYGKLRFVTSCKIVEVLNGQYDVEIIVSLIDRKIKYLVKWAILMCEGQLFRIFDTKKNDKEHTIKVYARHIFYDIQFGFHEDDRAVKKQIDDALKIAIPAPHSQVYEIIHSDITSYNTIYFVKENGTNAIFNIINRWGMGELVRDNFKVGILSHKGSDKGVTFTYRKTDSIEITEDTDNVVTMLFPTGKDGIKLTERYIAVPKWDTDEYPPFPIVREVKFEDCESEGELRELAKEKAKTIGLASVNIKINVSDLLNTNMYSEKQNLLSVEVGDIVTVKQPELNIRVKVECIKKEVDIVTGKTVIELGQPVSNLFDHIDNNNTTINLPSLSEYEEGLFYQSNGIDLSLDSTPYSLIGLAYAVEDSANLTAYVTASVKCTKAGIIKFDILIDNSKITFNPSETVTVGNHILSFVFPIIGVKPGISHVLNISSTGDAEYSIDKEQLQVLIQGQNVAGGMAKEYPHAEVTEDLKSDIYILYNYNYKENHNIEFELVTTCNVFEHVKFDKSVMGKNMIEEVKVDFID